MTRTRWGIGATTSVRAPDGLVAPGGFAVSDRKAIIGVSGIFLANGTMIGSLSVHFAALKDRLLLDPSTFSLVVMAMAVGAIVLMSVASLPLRRLGSAPVVVACSLAAPMAFVAPAVATGVSAVALSLVALGAVNGLLDTAMNARRWSGAPAVL